MSSGLTCTSGGARAGAATNSLIVVSQINRYVKECTHQLRVADQLASKPEEGLLEVVVGLGGDIVVLEVLLAVEGDSLGLHLTLLNINLVTGENDGDILADTGKIT